MTLLDTGSDSNYILEEIVNEIGLEIEPSSQSRIKLGKGECISAGNVTGKIQSKCKNFEHDIKFKVISDLSCQAILGINSMKELKMTIPMDENRKVTIFGNLECKTINGLVKVSENVDLMEAIPTDVPEIRTGSSEGFNEELNKIIYSLNVPHEVDQSKLNIKHEIILKENAQGVYTRPYRRSMRENEIITQEIMNLKEMDQFETAQASLHLL